MISIAKDKKDTKKKKRTSKFTKLFWLLVFAYAGYVLVQQQFQIHNLNAQANEITSQIEKAQEENDELNAVAESIGTDEYIERIARQKLGFVKPDEQVFVDTSK